MTQAFPPGRDDERGRGLGGGLNGEFGKGLGGVPWRGNWGWFVALGALAAVSGIAALALSITATIVSVLAIGTLMVLIGAVEIAVGFRARSWSRVLRWELAGILYVVAGVLAIVDPVPASVVITLLLGAGLLATGVVRLVAGLGAQDRRMRTPLLVAGAVTALLGLLIVLGWPGNSMVILGTLLGVDLLFSGIGWILFGLRVRAMG